MAYLKPDPFVKHVFNPLAKVTGMSGSKVLTLHGRRSGRTQSIPVIPVEYEGARYVVSTRGESEWVRNLRAAGKAELGGDSVRATELPVAERPPIIEAYRAKAGRMVTAYWKKLPDPSDHPIFRLEPR
jgi:hypothetical protein